MKAIYNLISILISVIIGILIIIHIPINQQNVHITIIILSVVLWVIGYNLALYMRKSNKK